MHPGKLEFPSASESGLSPITGVSPFITEGVGIALDGAPGIQRENLLLKREIHILERENEVLNKKCLSLEGDLSFLRSHAEALEKDRDLLLKRIEAIEMHSLLDETQVAFE